jgi:hypothetical protein
MTSHRIIIMMDVPYPSDGIIERIREMVDAHQPESVWLYSSSDRLSSSALDDIATWSRDHRVVSRPDLSGDGPDDRRRRIREMASYRTVEFFDAHSDGTLHRP